MARSGQALVEYILMIALVAVVLSLSVLLFQHAMAARLNDVSASVEAIQKEGGGAGQQPPGGGNPGQGNPGNPGQGNPGQGNPGQGNPGQGNP